MSEPLTLEARIRRLEDRHAINELIMRYGLVMDDRDVAAMPELFTADVEIDSDDGVTRASGRDAAVAMYTKRIRLIGPSNHVTHDRIVEFDATNPDVASGIVSSHAELERKGIGFVAALRYRDRYRREEGRWRFSARHLSFMYFVPIAEYADALGPGLAKRCRIYAEPCAADWPESLESWRRFFAV